MTSPANQPHTGLLMGDQATHPPRRGSCRPPLASLPRGGRAEPLDLEGWSSEFYSLGLVFPATVSQRGDGPEDAEWPQRLGCSPMCLAGPGMGWGGGGLLCGYRRVGGGRREPEEAREQGGHLGRFPKKGSDEERRRRRARGREKQRDTETCTEGAGMGEREKLNDKG